MSTHPADTASRSLSRCDWALGSPLLLDYHDREWGVPLHDDRRLFELLTLEGAQAGLSWLTILRRHDGYRACFHDFDIEKVAAMTEEDSQRLLASTLIIRNQAKIQATITNARAAMAVISDFGSFDTFIWGFVGGEPILSSPSSLAEVPAETDLSGAMSRDLKRRGFKFVGPTICYAFMQAAGLVNDHLVSCFRYGDLLPASDPQKRAGHGDKWDS